MTAWYISQYDINTMRGMATHGPYKTREEADAVVSADPYAFRLAQLTVGPDNLGPDWQENIRRWRAGEPLVGE